MSTNPKPFTDDDKKRLKEGIEARSVDDHWHQLPKEKLQALLARTEAAERALECYHDEYGNPIEVSHEYRQWRKAAGK